MAVQSGRHQTAPATVDVAEPQGMDEAAIRTAPPAFVGRERDMTALRETLARPPALVLVEGEAGIGKSRLIQEFLATSKVASQRSLVGVCPPYREPATLAPVVDALRHTCDDVAQLNGLSSLAGALRPLFPEWANELPPIPEPLEDAQAARHRLFAALEELMAALKTRLLVVEDVHLADEATLEFLLFLVAQQYFEQMGMVVSYRPEEVPEGSLLLRLSSRLPAGVTHHRITLEPLDVAGTAALVSSMLEGTHVSDEFATFMCERTDGLPLAIEESVRLLEDRADLVRRDGEWTRHSLDVLHVPPTVRDSTLERAQRLPPTAQRILEAAAVLSEPASEATLAGVAGLAADAARAVVIGAVSSRLLQEDANGQVAFRHALAAEAVYEAIHGSERRALHQRAGQALEAVSPQPLVRLARHFREAGDTARWCRYAEQAVDVAMATGDDRTAVTLLHGVLTGADVPPATRGRLARKLVAAAFSRKMAVDDIILDVVRTLRAALETPGLSADEEAQIRNPLGRLLLQVGEFEAAYAELERAIPDPRRSPVEAARIMITLGWPRAGSWRANVHLRWLERAADLLAADMPLADRLALTADRANALLQLGEPSGWAVAAEFPSEGSNADERLQIARGDTNIGDVAMLWGRYDEARRRLEAALEIANADGLPRIRDVVLVTLAHLDWLTGKWDGLAERVGALVEADESNAWDRDEAVLVVSLLYAAHGARGKAEQQLSALLERAERDRVADLTPAAAATLARLRLTDDRVDDALRITERSVEMIENRGIWVWATDVAPIRADALISAGEVHECGRLVAKFTRGLRGRDAPAPRAALGLCRAILAESEDDLSSAAAAYARSARAWDRLPRPYDALLTRERQARCLLAAGESSAGLALLTEVLVGLDDLGASGDADRVSHDLRRLGVDVRRRPVGRPGYGDQLSPRELDVVRLLITGKTDREIAEALFLSPKTVARHLHSARRKLKVHSRTALAVAAIETGNVTSSPPTDTE